MVRDPLPLDRLKSQVTRARSLLEQPATEATLDQLEAGVHGAGEAGWMLHEALEDGAEIDAALIQATEVLICATIRTLPVLQRAELDVLQHLSGGGAVAVEPAAVRRLAEVRQRSTTATVDLQRGLVVAYERHFAAVGA